ncbi:MAG: hypothetical protein N4A31_04780 [Rickettsiales bacterium]|jgi:hypothetical protein|nr:hypothetical protein [Rickettsiales bacterium]
MFNNPLYMVSAIAAVSFAGYKYVHNIEPKSFKISVSSAMAVVDRSMQTVGIKLTTGKVADAGDCYTYIENVYDLASKLSPNQEEVLTLTDYFSKEFKKNILKSSQDVVYQQEAVNLLTSSINEVVSRLTFQEFFKMSRVSDQVSYSFIHSSSAIKIEEIATDCAKEGVDAILALPDQWSGADIFGFLALSAFSGSVIEDLYYYQSNHTSV